jgi:RNA polymerase primary sigma factor
VEAIKSYLKEIKNIPLLTPQEEIKLSRLAKKGDTSARQKMIRANLRLVINIAKRYSHFGIPLMDLIEEGNMGLMRAVDKFNPRKGFRFSTYAAWWVKQAITRAIAEQSKLIRMPIYMNELMTRWKKTKERLSQQLRRRPSDEEIAKKMKLSQKKAKQINMWLSTHTSSLEAPIGEEGETVVGELIRDKGAIMPDQELERFLDKERLNGLLVIMSERERKVLDMRFGLQGRRPSTLAEVAKKLHISRERVRQIEEAALKKLKIVVRQKESKKTTQK